MKKVKKICVPIFSRANYGSIKALLNEINDSKKLKLQILLGGTANLYRFGRLDNIIKNEGFKVDEEISFQVEGDDPSVMVKTTGLAMLELATVFKNLKPDLILTVGDRYETMATAVAASYMNIPLAHTMGGEITGTIDESIRHAITKLAHIHFPASKVSMKNILKLGENKKNVHMTGCPRIDSVKNILSKKINLQKKTFEVGVGKSFNINENFIIVMFHPVTTEFDKNAFYAKELFSAINKIKINKIVLWPNSDSGSEAISSVIRDFREKKMLTDCWFVKNYQNDVFYHLMKNTSCMVGNSSSIIREGSFIGVPGVNIGTRQEGREQGKNVINAGYKKNDIYNKIFFQLQKFNYGKKKIKKDFTYGNGFASKKIVKILENKKISIQKKLLF
jgi:UDP-hydrolysing UDP-N-acetyl-D-glucosamine 2-epimerase